MLHLLSEHQLGGIRCIDSIHAAERSFNLFLLHNTKEYINFMRTEDSDQIAADWLIFLPFFVRNVLIWHRRRF